MAHHPPWNHYDPWNKHHYDTSSNSEEQVTVPSEFTWTWQESLLVIPLGIIVAGTILGNGLVLYAAATRSPNLRLPTHFFIANLALADFFVGVLVMPFLAVLQLTGRWYFGSMYCESWTVIHFWLCSASILSTCAICIERFIGVRYPLKHRSILSTRRVWAMIVCVWILAGCLSVCSLYIWPQPKSEKPYECAINQQIGHVIVAVVGILYVPAVIMIVLYMKIFVIARRHLKFVKKNSFPALAISSSSSSEKATQPKRIMTTFFVKSFIASSKLSVSENEPSSISVVSTGTTTSGTPRGSVEDLEVALERGSNYQKEKEMKKDSAISATTDASIAPSASTTSGTTNWNASLIKNVQSRKQINLAKRLSLLVGILLMTYMPFFTLYLIMAFHPGSINLRVFSGFGWVRYCNSAINPVLYALTVPAYRKAMLEMILNGVGKVKRFTTLKRTQSGQ